MLKTEINNTPAGTLIIINGRLDTANAADFEQEISVIRNNDNPNLIIDCTGLTYISSTGLRSFLSLQKEVNSKKGQLRLRNMNEIIKEIFDMTGFTELFIFE